MTEEVRKEALRLITRELQGLTQVTTEQVKEFKATTNGGLTTYSVTLALKEGRTATLFVMESSK